MMNNNNKLRKTITLLMAFLLSVSIAFLTTTLITRLTLLRGDWLQEALSKSQYYTLVTKDINTNLTYRGTPFGIPEATLQGLITQKQVEEDINLTLHQTIMGEPNTINTTFLEAPLQQKLQALLTQQGIPLGQAQQEAINEYTLLAKEEYQKGIQIPFLGVYKEIRDYANRIVPFALLGLVGASTFCTIFLTRLYPWKQNRRLLAYSLQGAGLMTLALPAFLLIQGAYKRIQLAPEHFYRLAMELAANYLLTLVGGGLLLLLASAILLLLPAWLERRRKADAEPTTASSSTDNTGNTDNTKNQEEDQQPQNQSQPQTNTTTPTGPTPRRSRRHKS